MDRRNFLKATAATSTLSFVGCSWSEDAPKTQKHYGSWQTTLCQGCTSWCSVEAFITPDNRVTSVRGNAASKANHGYICPRPHLAIEQQYDPDRVKTPLIRTNPKKGRGIDPGFKPISWDEALDIIAEKMLEQRAKGTPERFALFRGRYSYLRDILYKAVPKILGSPNSISHSSICAEAEKFASYYTEGYWDYNDFDLENTHYVLSWGVDPLSSNRQVPHFINIWNKVHDQAKVTVIDPRFSATASKADKWLPLIPGEDGALVSAIAHVILTSGHWNREFVGDFKEGKNLFKIGESVDEDSFEEKYTYGIVAWWNQELKDKTPEWAAQRCGIDAKTIESVATEFALAAPRAISWVATGISMQPRGAYAAMGAHALNGLVGSIDNIGGVLQSQKVPINETPDIAPYMDALAKKHTKMPIIDRRGTLKFPALKKKVGGGVVTNNVAQSILDENPYPIEVAIGYWNNYAFSCSGTQRWESAFAKLPFFAHITTNISETTQFADIVLPAAYSMFEKYGFVKSKQNLHSYVHIQKPVVKPLFDVKMDETEISFLLAKKLAQKGFDTLLKYYQNEFRDPESGKIPQDEKEFTLYAMKYYTYPLYSGEGAKHGDALTSFEELLEKGVWNSKRHPYKERWGKFKTQTHKFEFYSKTLKKVLQEHAQNHAKSVDEVMEVLNYTARGDRAFIPHYEEPLRYGDEKEYPLIFSESRSRLNREARSANSPWYYAFKDVDPGDEKDEDVVKINPKTAQELGLANLQKVKVSSINGSIECKVKLFEGIRPGCAVKTYGQGHWAYGRVACEDFLRAKPRGGNNNELYVADYEHLSGSNVRHGGFMRVKIEKLEV